MPAVAELHFFPTQMEEFFFFGSLMIADMLIFIFLSWRSAVGYTYSFIG